MEKLLHERLRENGWEEDTSSSYEVADEIERDYIPRTEHDAILRNVAECADGFNVTQILKTFGRYKSMPFEDGQTVTEWLDKWFIKRPLFEDGEPVQFDDELWDGPYEKKTVKAINFSYQGTVSINYMEGRAAEWRDGIYRFKRPSSRVVDADGVDINVGDTVWNINNGCEHEVIGLPKPGCYQSVGIRNVATGSEGGIDAPLLTHDRPVFDVEGVRICKGDTVWRVEDGLEMRVLAVGDEALAESCDVLTEIDGKGPYHYNGKELTHKEPDSYRRIAENAVDVLRMVNLRDGDELKARLDALIERGA